MSESKEVGFTWDKFFHIDLEKVCHIEWLFNWLKNTAISAAVAGVGLGKVEINSSFPLGLSQAIFIAGALMFSLNMAYLAVAMGTVMRKKNPPRWKIIPLLGSVGLFCFMLFGALVVKK